MIDSNIVINLIRRNGNFKLNENDDSYYKIYKTQINRPIQVRVSNQGTHLCSWYDEDFNPSCSTNICIVFSKNSDCVFGVHVDMDVKDKEGNLIGQKKSFEVIQYVYDCELLEEKDIALINQRVQSISSNEVFKDPFEGTTKQAKVYILQPNILRQ